MEQEPLYLIASRKRRIAAFFIDHFIMTSLIVSLAFIALGSNFMEEDNPSKFIITLFSILIPGMFLYLSKDSIKGNSIGKWAMGIMIRDERNPDIVPSYSKLLLRNLLLIIWPVEFIVLATNNEKKRLGDKIANTIVVKNPNKPTKLPRILIIVGAAISFCVLLFFIVGNTMKNSAAYKVSVAEIEKNEQIISETGGIKGYGMIPTGNIKSVNGYGQAQLEIKVLGNQKDVNVSVYLEKEPNKDWKIIEMQ
ncbi:RDD family protein [Flavobacterium sp. CBA20B-1]|uniref:RDD family protein n=1 Tax=unclassified Flavobacterium TaxID=196869 RepID=UPI002225A9D3|nr:MULTISPECIES: RDD family protein [unclassified Flavobacterium]WCM43309.1 RDD family protein [Flavobacterium sp. CBA20B-1]